LSVLHWCIVLSEQQDSAALEELLATDGPCVTGVAEYLDAVPGAHDPLARICVPFQVAGLDLEFLALLDTGGHYCILNETAARRARKHLASPLDQVRLQTARGIVAGDLYSHPIRLIAEIGEPLDIEAIVFLPNQWSGPCFLGYTGFLDRLRFAVDPRRNQFFFGPL
jgi:hypothetical protein